jgi:RecA/RadA recombinase
MSLLDKLKSVGSIKYSEVLSESSFFNMKDSILTELPILNIAFSGEVDGGLVPGLSIIAGPSKSFKTLLTLYCMKAYFDKYPDSVALFYDSEFGVTPEYIENYGIDSSRIIHIPVEHIESLKFDIVKRLKEINRGDKVFIMIDSIGSLPSKKEVDDAVDEKSVADMTRAKAIRSLLRIITPHLTMKDIPCLAINHTYQTMEMFSKAVVGGGCLEAGTKILLESGSYKNVEDFEVGDSVQTLQGPKEVTEIWNPDTLIDGEPQCYEVFFEDGTSVVCSDKHKFLIQNNDDVDPIWVDTENLVVGSNAITL